MIAMYRTPEITSQARLALSPLPITNCASSTPAGSRHSNETMPTTPIGISCSVRGNSAALPCARVREATIPERPHRRHADRARADEAHLVTPGVVRQGVERRIGQVGGIG